MSPSLAIAVIGVAVAFATGYIIIFAELTKRAVNRNLASILRTFIRAATKDNLPRTLEYVHTVADLLDPQKPQSKETK